MWYGTTVKIIFRFEIVKWERLYTSVNTSPFESHTTVDILSIKDEVQ